MNTRILRILVLSVAAFVARSSAAEYVSHEVFAKVVQGHVAFCRSTEVDELQVIGEPHRLTPEEADKLAAFLSAEDTWYERMPNGELKSGNSFCVPVWDFKFQLYGYNGEPIISMRLCSSCRQVMAMADYKWIETPNLRPQKVEVLFAMLDKWFPDWRTRTKQNRAEWSKRPKPEQRKKPATKESSKPAVEAVQNRP